MMAASTTPQLQRPLPPSRPATAAHPLSTLEKRCSFAEGTEAKKCFTWDGEPFKLHPTKRVFPHASQSDINVFETGSDRIEKQKRREQPQRQAGIKVFLERTRELLEGHGGRGVDFSGLAVEKQRHPKRPCRDIWAWQREERRLSIAIARRAGVERYNRNRVQYRDSKRKATESPPRADGANPKPPQTHHSKVRPQTAAAVGVASAPSAGIFHHPPVPVNPAIARAAEEAQRQWMLKNASQLAKGGKEQSSAPPSGRRPLSARVRHKIAELANTFLEHPLTTAPISATSAASVPAKVEAAASNAPVAKPLATPVLVPRPPPPPATATAQQPATAAVPGKTIPLCTKS